MNKAFINFCKDIKYEIPEYLLESEILDAIFVDNKFDITFNFFSIPIIDDLKFFLDSIKQNFSFKVSFNITYMNKNYTLQNIYDYLLFSFCKNENENNK